MAVTEQNFVEALDNPSGDDLSTFVLPDYDRGAITNVVPALLEYPPLGDGWMPAAAAEADQVVLVVIDGLGWHQLRDRLAIAPNLAAATGGPITTVAPSTTAAALTSITTGSAPGEHGVIGYKIRVGGETLNALRWTTGRGDVRDSIDPRDFQALPAFGGRVPAVVNKADFVGSGFTIAHLDGVDYRPYGTMATMVHEVGAAARNGDRFVYAYYDGLDRVGHERGHGDVFDAEFAFVDRLIGDIRNVLPDSAALLVTADHGQVDTAGEVRPLDDRVLQQAIAVSGEDRFLWLHTDDPERMIEIATEAHGDRAWIAGVDEVLERGLFGRRVTSVARQRFGDVAVVSRGRGAFVDPRGRIPNLLGRHGSLTAAEMMVPLLSV